MTEIISFTTVRNASEGKITRGEHREQRGKLAKGLCGAQTQAALFLSSTQKEQSCYGKPAQGEELCSCHARLHPSSPLRTVTGPVCLFSKLLTGLINM